MRGLLVEHDTEIDTIKSEVCLVSRKKTEIVKFTPEGMRTSQFARGEYELLEAGRADDLTEVVKLGIKSLEGARFRKCLPPKYEPDEQGLENFVGECEKYLQKINEINSSLDEPFAVIPDHEGLCAFLGISRETYRKYKARSERWAYCIGLIDTVITSCKKSLALRGKVPPMFAIFDLVNNGGYYNTNTFTPDHLEGFEVVESPEQRLKRLQDKYRFDSGGDTGHLNG